ncbi:MAG: glutamate-5-semialdehyde dehydrogenase, partial [Alphaproteobacteria bacterium]|nr:glutamate-5-semialdehyde dehydrogenase [Alphaproteobacteria bacterium]
MNDMTQTPEMLISNMGQRARKAAAVLAGASDAQKAQALRAAAQALRDAERTIIAANARDMENGAMNGLSPALLDRLKLDSGRVAGIAAAVEAVADLTDPVGAVIDESTRPNGMVLQRVRVPLGVIGIIYESRPNVTADAAALCLRSGNAVILRGGSEAMDSNRAIHAAMAEGIKAAGLPTDAVQLVPVTDRAAVGAMLKAAGLIDIIIPRGGKSLVARVQEEARVPVLAHLDGICHTYIHSAAAPDMARDVALNAKMRRTGICGAMETLLIDKDFADPRPIISALIDAGCEVRGDEGVRALDRLSLIHIS